MTKMMYVNIQRNLKQINLRSTKLKYLIIGFNRVIHLPYHLKLAYNFIHLAYTVRDIKYQF